MCVVFILLPNVGPYGHVNSLPGLRHGVVQLAITYNILIKNVALELFLYSNCLLKINL